MSHVNDAIYMLTCTHADGNATPLVLNMYTYISRSYVCISKASKMFLDSCMATGCFGYESFSGYNSLRNVE